MDEVLLHASGPFGHDVGAELVERLACEAHKLQDLRPRDCVTEEVYFHGERTELEFAGVVLEDSFPTYAGSTDGSDGREHDAIGTACIQVGLYDDGLTAAFASHEF